MEKKLKNAAEKLPVPTLDFQTIEQAAVNGNKHGRKARMILRVAIAVILIICLCTTVFAYGKAKYGLWSGMNSHAFSDVTVLSWQYDYLFPKTLGDSPFISVHTLYGSTRGATHLEALLMPTYKLCSIYYGIERSEVWDEGRHEWTENQISVSFGTTENKNWKYHFSVSEDGICENANADSQRQMEYKGQILYLYTIGDTENIRWIDEERKIVIDVTVWNDEIDVLKVAKELIDLNR